VDALLALVFSIHEPIVGLQDKLLLTGLAVGPNHQLRWNISLLVAVRVVAKKKTTLAVAVVVLAVSERM
jgi:predicted MFS family arabinose efflux permease